MLSPGTFRIDTSQSKSTDNSPKYSAEVTHTSSSASCITLAPEGGQGHKDSIAHALLLGQVLRRQVMALRAQQVSHVVGQACGLGLSAGAEGWRWNHAHAGEMPRYQLPTAAEIGSTKDDRRRRPLLLRSPLRGVWTLAPARSRRLLNPATPPRAAARSCQPSSPTRYRPPSHRWRWSSNGCRKRSSGEAQSPLAGLWPWSGAMRRRLFVVGAACAAAAPLSTGTASPDDGLVVAQVQHVTHLPDLLRGAVEVLLCVARRHAEARAGV